MGVEHHAAKSGGMVSVKFLPRIWGVTYLECLKHMGVAWGAWMVHGMYGDYACTHWWAPGMLKGAWDMWVRSGCVDGPGHVHRGQDVHHHGAS